MDLPERFRDEEELDEFLSRPNDATTDLFRRIDGDVAILGIAGKIGVQLGMAVRRACEAAGSNRHVYGVSRFADSSARERLERAGVETIACDLLDRRGVDALPDAPLVVFMAGRKFGTTGQENGTWASNVLLPGLVVERYRSSRIAAFSTACVYPFTDPRLGGSRENDATQPVGEYAWTTLGRERVFEWASASYGTKVSLIRLSYAVDLRYGVLHDVASRVSAGLPVDLGVPCANVIWQGDAIAQSLLSLAEADSPPYVLNVSGPENVSIRRLAEEFGRLLGVAPVFAGEEGSLALLANTQKAAGRYAYPRVPLQSMIEWTADWLKRGMRSLGKPTHFDAADGRF